MHTATVAYGEEESANHPGTRLGIQQTLELCRIVPGQFYIYHTWKCWLRVQRSVRFMYVYTASLSLAKLKPSEGRVHRD